MDAFTMMYPFSLKVSFFPVSKYVFLDQHQLSCKSPVHWRLSGSIAATCFHPNSSHCFVTALVVLPVRHRPSTQKVSPKSLVRSVSKHRVYVTLVRFKAQNIGLRWSSLHSSWHFCFLTNIATCRLFKTHLKMMLYIADALKYKTLCSNP